jgi:4-amino-4-deoxy-L-arabinose transferase-like glycosyltransferase
VSRAPAWLSPALVLVVVLLLFIGRSWAAWDTDLVDDEGYYTLWSLHLGPGYLDHPPAVAWTIALGRSLLGENSLGVRAFALLTPLLISLALYRTGAILFGTAVGLLAVLWYNLTFGISLSLLATPDAPSMLFWMLALWALAEFLRSRNPNWWLLVGLFAGLGVLGKYTNLFLGLGLVLFLLSSAERRRWFRHWQLWAGGVVALLVLAPNIWWNYQNDWAGIGFQGRRITGLFASDPARNYLELLGGQAIFLGPVTLLLALGGTIAWLLRRPTLQDREALALPVLSGLPALLYFIYHASHSSVGANWLLPLWPMLTLIAAWAAIRGLPSVGRHRWAAPTALYAQTIYGLVVVLFLQLVVILHPPQLERLDRTRDMRGWTEVRAAIDAIAEAQGARWIGVINHYGILGLLASYGHFAGSDLPMIGIGDGYRYTFRPLPGAETLEGPGLLVVHSSSDRRWPPEELFREVSELERVERRFQGEAVARYRVLAVSEPTPAFFDAIGP